MPSWISRREPSSASTARRASFRTRGSPSRCQDGYSTLSSSSPYVLDPLEELLRDDLIRVNVGAVEDGGSPDTSRTRWLLPDAGGARR
jgi:hypothetical protein